ncbi:MAG TPA: geranylgeranyl reductase family protein [bacterium]|nr:geranylgeranyl reductase family protein [bacterium]
MKTYDVIVIGAGPAGSSAARHTANNNLKTLLIDKSVFPRIKPCAAGLPKHIKEILDFDYSKVLKKISTATIFTFNMKSPVKIQNDEVKIEMTMRSDFDTLLVENAVNSGVEFRDGQRAVGIEEDIDSVKVITEKENYFAKYVIGADGAFSVVAKSLGLMKDRVMGWSINAEVYVSSGQLERHGDMVNIEMGLVPAGYAWIFPKGDHLSCGIGTNMTKNIFNFKKYLFDYLNNHDSTKNYTKIFMKGHPLPHSYSEKIKINTNRVFLAGDAASLVEPLSGEGIYYAIKSGITAAKHILENIRINSSPENYSKEIDNTLRKEFYYAERFARIFHQFPKLTYELGVSNKLVNGKFLSLLTGGTTYQKMYEELKPLYSNAFFKPAVSIISKISSIVKKKVIR